jgi:hypothetical protein
MPAILGNREHLRLGNHAGHERVLEANNEGP